jgi:anaerobic magnesium-protoporphyrin IX monomethyl ester cyclase
LGRHEKPIYPLGLAYLAATLGQHEVKAFDPNTSSDPYGELAHQLRQFEPDVVGIALRNIDSTNYIDSFVYLNTLQPTLDIIGKESPNAKKIIGGAGFSMYAAKIMKKFHSIDFGLLLEAEESFPALLEDLNHPEKIGGVYYRFNGEVVLSGPAQLPDFDALPSPKWDVVDLSPYKGQIDSIGIQAKRGCGLKCAYCNYCYLNGAHYRLRNPEKIGNEISRLIKDYQIDHFIFVDSIFNIPAAHAEEICKELIRQKVQVPWTAWYNERVFTEDFYKLTHEAGCRYYSFSPDAYSEKSLKLLHKNLTMADIQGVYELACRESGAYFGFNFFVNPPGQTYVDFIKLMIFYVKVRVKLHDKFYGLSLNNIRVEPDSEMFDIAIKDGHIRADVDLLVETTEELRKLFYTNPKTPLIDHAFRLFAFAANLKHRLIR